jgi:hypothetical protein
MERLPALLGHDRSVTVPVCLPLSGPFAAASE